MALDPNGPLTQYRTQIDLNTLDIVDLQTGFNSLNLVSEEVLRASSDVTQQPGSTDTPLQLVFGAGVSVPEINLDNAGNFTFLVAGNYQIRLRLVFGRTGSPQNAIVFARALINGNQLGDSVSAVLDDGNFSVPATFEGVVPFAVNDVLTVEILRSSAGNNSGGVFAQPSPLAGWAAAPSCLMVITRAVIESTP